MLAEIFLILTLTLSLVERSSGPQVEVCWDAIPNAEGYTLFGVRPDTRDWRYGWSYATRASQSCVGNICCVTLPWIEDGNSWWVNVEAQPSSTIGREPRR